MRILLFFPTFVFLSTLGFAEKKHHKKYETDTVLRFRFEDEKALERLKEHYQDITPPFFIPGFLTGQAPHIESHLEEKYNHLVRWTEDGQFYLSINPPYTVIDDLLKDPKNLKNNPDHGLALTWWYVSPFMLSKTAYSDKKARMKGVLDQEELLSYATVEDLKKTYELLKSTPIKIMSAESSRYLSSLLELNASHIPVLKEIREISYKHLQEQYDVDLSRDTVRIYVHFPYTHEFATLHIHVRVNHASHALEDEKCFSLDDIIHHLESDLPIHELILNRQRNRWDGMLANLGAEEPFQGLPGIYISYIDNMYKTSKHPDATKLKRTHNKVFKVKSVAEMQKIVNLPSAKAIFFDLDNCVLFPYSVLDKQGKSLFHEDDRIMVARDEFNSTLAKMLRNFLGRELLTEDMLILKIARQTIMEKSSVTSLETAMQSLANGDSLPSTVLRYPVTARSHSFGTDLLTFAQFKEAGVNFSSLSQLDAPDLVSELTQNDFKQPVKVNAKAFFVGFRNNKGAAVKFLVQKLKLNQDKSQIVFIDDSLEHIESVTKSLMGIVDSTAFHYRQIDSYPYDEELAKKQWKQFYQEHHLAIFDQMEKHKADIMLDYPSINIELLVSRASKLLAGLSQSI